MPDTERVEAPPDYAHRDAVPAELVLRAAGCCGGGLGCRSLAAGATGLALRAAGRDDRGEALLLYGRALDLDPRCVPALVGSGVALAGLGRHDEALDSPVRAVEVDAIGEHQRLWGESGGALATRLRWGAVRHSELTHEQKEPARAFYRMQEARNPTAQSTPSAASPGSGPARRARTMLAAGRSAR